MGVTDTSKLKLYVRLPVKIVDEEQVRALHPGIVQVSFPRQKSRRWCIVEFDRSGTKGGVAELKAVKVDGKKIVVRAHGKKNKGAQ